MSIVERFKKALEDNKSEEQKKFVSDMEETFQQIPPDEPLYLKYFELSVRRAELVHLQENQENIKKLKQFRQNCQAYLNSTKSKTKFKKFLKTNFNYELTDESDADQLILPCFKIEHHCLTVDWKTGVISNWRAATGLNLFEHIDPVFNVLTVNFN